MSCPGSLGVVNYTDHRGSIDAQGGGYPPGGYGPPGGGGYGPPGSPPGGYGPPGSPPGGYGPPGSPPGGYGPPGSPPSPPVGSGLGFEATEPLTFGWNAVTKDYAGVGLPLVVAFIVASIPQFILSG